MGKENGWLVGANYMPAYAINQLEMWQADTFDPKAIDRELALAQSLGFNSMRVFLHHLLWEQDAQGFLKRMEQFLSIAEQHKIRPMFVLFDSCWATHPKLGKQPEPRPGLHNSGWVQSPGAPDLQDKSRHEFLKQYVLGVVGHFRDDSRICAWDVWNEPDNPNTSSYKATELANKVDLVRQLLVKTFAWCREAKPRQPLTTAPWIGPWYHADKLKPMEQVQLELSDVISFHHYGKLEQLKEYADSLRHYDRPLLCTEYMARPVGSTFNPHLGWMKEQNIAAYNWGFVDGKSQTIYPWDSWRKAYTAEPPIWFHDIFRGDGRPYKPEEVEYIRQITGLKP